MLLSLGPARNWHLSTLNKKVHCCFVVVVIIVVVVVVVVVAVVVFFIAVNVVDMKGARVVLTCVVSDYICLFHSLQINRLRQLCFRVI